MITSIQLGHIPHSAHVLGLDVAHQEAVEEDGQVRCAAVDAPGFVDGLDGGAEGFQEIRQGGTVRVLRRVACGEVLCDLGEVWGDG
jgi:hypothetical protein